MSQANGLLKESLNKLMKKLEKLEGDQLLEFQPIGDAIIEIQAADNSESSFIKNLIKLSDVVIEARKRTGSPLQDLPVPPYDLWLPFKVESLAPQSPEDLVKAFEIFSGELSGIASHWRPIASMLRKSSEPKSTDHELVELRDRMVDKLDDCNDCYSANIEKGKRLFNPTEGATHELFFRVIPVPVTSARDFSTFIIALYRVFDEGLPSEVRQWKKHKHDLPASVLRVAEEVLEGESFTHMGILRNKFAVHDAKEEAATLAPIFHKLIGARSIATDDGPSWLRLQKAVLRMLLPVLNDVCLILNSSENSFDSK